MIPENIKKQILEKADAFSVIAHYEDLMRSGSTYYCTCPECGASGKNKGLKVSKTKRWFGCTCGLKGSSGVDYLMNVKKMDFSSALKALADQFHIDIQEVPRLKGPQKKLVKQVDSFRDKQLRESGISDADQKAKVIDEEKTLVVDVFESGTRDQYGKLVSGDDMIIWYYDLEGKQVMYQLLKSTKTAPLFRVRWSNPDLHKDKSGKSMKYSSPYGSGSHLFIPQAIRDHYHERRIIKRLFIQEGEKKAIKSCKHGLLSVGIMGIQNIASDGHLPYDLQLLIQACQVEEVVFLLDSDWDDLSSSLKAGERVDKRPYAFYHAVRNFREYFKTFINLEIYLQIYFAYVKKNEKADKGIDDLLTNTLAGQENRLLADVNMAMNEKHGSGEFIQLHNISTVSDLKLLEFWSLQKVDAFVEKYREELLPLPEFIIGKIKWRFNEDGLLEPAQPLQEDEQYWESSTKQHGGNEKKEYRFRYMYAYNFLRRRGFGRYMMANRQYVLVRIENKVVSIVEPYQIRDFVTEFTKVIVAKMEQADVMDLLYRGNKMYLGPDSLGNLDFIHPQFESSDKNHQILYFKNKYWKISADGIEEHPLSDLKYHVWSDKINDFNATLLEDEFFKVARIDETLLKEKPKSAWLVEQFPGQFDVAVTSLGNQCHFLRFILNTGEFFWRKFMDTSTWKPRETDERTTAEKLETNLHFLSKLTAFGYCLHKHRDKSLEKAIIAMDGKIGEIGESNGRSGKSIAGFGIGKVIPQAYIGGKSKDLTEDPFIWEEVTEKTDNIFLDDVRANIDFEFFFPVITGKITINTKGTKKYTLSEADTPKIFITTNHAINGESGSFKDRQHLIAFSDYYNENHKPVEDFGINFFDEWDEVQWNLFYNFMARCLQLYFRAGRLGWGKNGSGLIEGPMDRLERRRLRQFMGENFLTWADEYFGTGDDIDAELVVNSNLNNKIPRLDMHNDFKTKNPGDTKFNSAYKFRKKILAFCQYRGLTLNPHVEMVDGQPGSEKTAGVEYFTIANKRFQCPPTTARN